MEWEKVLYGSWLQGITQSRRQLEDIYRIFGDARELFEKGVSEEHRCLFSSELIQAIEEARTEEHLKKMENQLVRGGIGYVTIYDAEYPRRLSEISDAPFGIYYQGKLPGSDQPCIGVVGTRNCTNYGRETANYFAKVLSDSGITVISGLALGIDGIAHRGAINGNGGTVAVLGSGIGVPYPKENYSLYHEILRKDGCVISEYPPGSPPLQHHFPRRNRIISGLSDGVLVVEAREKSGTLITVDCALEQGREVYVIPGRIDERNSVGCNNLIKQGARLVTDPTEIIGELLIQYPFASSLREEFEDEIHRLKMGQTEIQNSLASEKKIVYSCLRLDPKHFDVLVKETKIKPVKLAELLSEMEDLGIIREPAPNYFSRPYQG